MVIYSLIQLWGLTVGSRFNFFLILHKGDILCAAVNESVSGDRLCLLAIVKLKIRQQTSDGIWVMFFDAHWLDWCCCWVSPDSFIHQLQDFQLFSRIFAGIFDAFLSHMTFYWHLLQQFLHSRLKKKRNTFSSGTDWTSNRSLAVLMFLWALLWLTPR